MKRTVLAGLAIILGATVAIAQNDSAGDPVARRIEVMKKVGDATKVVGDMAKGATPFDLAKVQAALAIHQEAAKASPALYPDTAKTGKDSTSAPAIWENKVDFEARFKKWDEVAAAAALKITDEASFKKEMPAVLGNCKGCHDEYRVKK